MKLSNDLTLVLFIVAGLRIYLEIYLQGPKGPLIRQKLFVVTGRLWGEQRSYQIHKFGLIMSVGYVILFAPQVLFYS